MQQGSSESKTLQMSGSERRTLEAQERFHLLRTIHSFFCLSLPTLPTTTDVENGWYRGGFEADLLDDITILRSDIKSLPIKLQQIDIDQVTSDDDLNQLIKAFDSVLGLFEDSITGEGAQTPQVRT